MRVDASEAVFVGDRLLDDVEGARNVGMRTVLTQQFRQEVDPTISADALIQDLAELPLILRSWAADVEQA